MVESDREGTMPSGRHGRRGGGGGRRRGQVEKKLEEGKKVGDLRSGFII
jgi:hypothetical protein